MQEPTSAEAPKKKQKRHRELTGSEAEISFKLAPSQKNDADGTKEHMVLAALEKPFLRTSGKLKVMHLKKYLCKKLSLKQPKEVEILCKGDTLGPELSLHFILRCVLPLAGACWHNARSALVSFACSVGVYFAPRRTRWFDNASDLVLTYRKTPQSYLG